MHLIETVILSRQVAWCLHSGELSLNSIRYALLKNGYNLDDISTILDFGCGWDHRIRH